jgi:phosphatidylserine/phosphatidylglycerophosphate/cardiolipin synthase-like enzyme
MRVQQTVDGLTLRAIAGTYNVLLAMDLTPDKRKGCLGFTIERTDLESGEQRWLPNMLRFARDADDKNVTTARAPLQKFRWGDYTVEPGKKYRYRVIARSEKIDDIIKAGHDAEAGHFDHIPGGISVEIKTEDNHSNATAVFFNRGAAASEAYVRKFGNADPSQLPDDKRAEAFAWLSRGLEEALIAFIGLAKDSNFAIHAAVYEFQKPELLHQLKLASGRGVDVKVAYHGRTKPPPKNKPNPDKTAQKNRDAIAAEGIEKLVKPRKADPQGAIMHNKFVVLLEKGTPIAVWTGSTNWTEGAIYGQLNVGHAIYDPKVAAKYDAYFALLFADKGAPEMKTGTAGLTPVPSKPDAIAKGVTPIFSPQSALGMIDLYAALCAQAKLLLVSAPFALHPNILKVLRSDPQQAVRFMMADTAKSFGKAGEMNLMQRAPGNEATVATVLKTPLNDFQGHLLEHTESFHHAGVHVHSKVIAADPFGPDPILVTGSANFSANSTVSNDSNSLIIRGDTAVADIYATDFMRMFEHYWFRAHQSGATPNSKGKSKVEVMSLKEDSSWTDPYYKQGTSEMLDRLAFIGAADAGAPSPRGAKRRGSGKAPAAPKTATKAAKKRAPATRDTKGASSGKSRKTAKKAAKKRASPKRVAKRGSGAKSGARKTTRRR